MTLTDWLGRFLTSDLYKRDGTPIPERAQESIRAYQKAEKLDSRLHGGCLSGYAYAYQALKKPDKALAYLKAAMEAKPELAKNPGSLRWRAHLEQQLQKKSS